MGARNESVPLLRQGDGLTVDEQRPFGASRGVPRSPVNSNTDLDTRAQIHNMVVAFYRELVMDEILGPPSKRSPRSTGASTSLS
jgi:hypothetical protein